MENGRWRTKDGGQGIEDRDAEWSLPTPEDPGADVIIKFK